MTKREARRLGRDAGEAAASWKFDGNTTDATYRAFLRGYADCDPAVMDAYAPPSWLSGEWSGESITELLGEDATDEHCDEYEQAADAAYWSTLERTARYQIK